MEFTDTCKNNIDGVKCKKGYCQCFGVSCGDFENGHYTSEIDNLSKEQ